MVDEEEIATFERDGVVCLRQRFESHWLETLAAGFEKNLAAPGPNASQFTPEGNPGGYFWCGIAFENTGISFSIHRRLKSPGA